MVGSLYVEIWRKLKDIIDKMKIVKRTELGEKFPPAFSPMAFVCVTSSSFSPASGGKSLFLMRYEIGVCAEYEDVTKGMERVMNICDQIRQELEKDRTLGGLVDNLEVLSFEPHWRGYGGITVHWCGLVIEARKLV